MAKAKGTVRITVDLAPWDYDALERLRKNLREVSKTATIRRLIRQAFDELS